MNRVLMKDCRRQEKTHRHLDHAGGSCSGVASAKTGAKNSGVRATAQKDKVSTAPMRPVHETWRGERTSSRVKIEPGISREAPMGAT